MGGPVLIDDIRTEDMTIMTEEAIENLKTAIHDMIKNGVMTDTNLGMSDPVGLITVVITLTDMKDLIIMRLMVEIDLHVGMYIKHVKSIRSSIGLFNKFQQ